MQLIRIAFLVDPVDPRSALTAVLSCCMTWGGGLQLLLPCEPGGAPDAFWIELLNRHDPDVIVDLVGASVEFAEKQRSRFDRRTRRWNQVTDTLLVVGASVYAPLRRRQRDRLADRPPRTLLVDPLAQHPLALPLAYCWGYLAPAVAEKGIVNLLGDEEGSHHDFVHVERIDPLTLAEPEVIRLITQQPYRPVDDGDSSAESALESLVELTTTNLPVHWSHELQSGPEPPYQPDGDPGLLRLVVVGDPASVPDLCLAWNLRALRPVDVPFPVWVAPEWQSDRNVAARLDDARRVGRNGYPRREREPALGLLSASLSRDDLTAAATNLTPPSVVFNLEAFGALLPTELRVGATRESIAAFHEGAADVALPDYSELGDFGPLSPIGWRVDIDGWAVPRTSDRGRFRSGEASRLVTNGIEGSLIVAGSRRKELVRVGTLDAWEVVEGIAAAAGYRASISDKGRQAIAVLELLGDSEEGLPILASSAIYHLLQEMAQIVPRQAVQQELGRRLGRPATADELRAIVAALQEGAIGGGQFERQHWTWDRLNHELQVKKAEARWIVDWLVRRRLLFRGYEIVSGNCGLRRWYPIDHLAAQHLCAGCQTTGPTPLAVDAPLTWRYRLNETVALAVDQGVLPHLLAIHRMLYWSQGREARFLGVLPGVVFEPVEQDGPAIIEVDLLAVHRDASSSASARRPAPN